MEKNLRKLNLLFRFTSLKPEMFYSISVNERAIKLQGKFDPDKVLKIKKLRMTQSISTIGYIEFYKNNIEITLT